MVRCHTLLSLRELGLRAEFLNAQLERLDELIVPLVTARAPGLPGWYGAGPDTAAVLLIAAGDHLGRLRSEAPPRLKITVRDESCSWPTRANPPRDGVYRVPVFARELRIIGRPAAAAGRACKFPPGALTSPGAAQLTCPGGPKSTLRCVPSGRGYRDQLLANEPDVPALGGQRRP
jgi:hypothetical protein